MFFGPIVFFQPSGKVGFMVFFSSYTHYHNLSSKKENIAMNDSVHREGSCDHNATITYYTYNLLKTAKSMIITAATKKKRKTFSIIIHIFSEMP